MTKLMTSLTVGFIVLVLGVLISLHAAHAHVDSAVALIKLHHINQAEIRAATLALAKTESPDVKNFAQYMIDQHTAADKNVQSVADNERVQFGVFQQADFESAASDRLSQLSGKEYDLAFLHAMKAGHKDALSYLDSLKNETDDPQLKSLVAKLTPDVKEHKKMATDLLSKTQK